MDIRKRANLWRIVISCMSVMLLQLNSPFVHADGDETLGPPSVFIESGTGIAAAGVGLSLTQPGTINIDVPAKPLSIRYCCTGKAVTLFRAMEITPLP